jgi:hypothetical protein
MGPHATRIDLGPLHEPNGFKAGAAASDTLACSDTRAKAGSPTTEVTSELERAGPVGTTPAI